MNRPLAELLDAGGEQLKAHAVFGNAEIWVLEAVWSLDASGSTGPRILAHSLQDATSLPHMSLSSPLSSPTASQAKRPTRSSQAPPVATHIVTSNDTAAQQRGGNISL